MFTITGQIPLFAKPMLFLAAALLLANLTPAQAAPAPKTTEPEHAVSVGPKQAWQESREKLWGTIRGMKAGDAAATKHAEEILDQFEDHPFARTPMESMDILGAIYIPKLGIDEGFEYVVAQTALGWYDAMRFGTESGRNEIQQNERFFTRAFILAGPDSSHKLLQYMQTEPEKAQKAIEQGLALADEERIHPKYDMRWPSAYGLEPVICAISSDECEMPPSVPTTEWNALWDSVKQQVIAYYTLTDE